MTECVIMRLDKATIVRVIHDEPKFSEMFMAFPSVFGLLALILLYRANNAISSRLEAKAAMALTFAERR
jgi:hypothetical protein